MKTKTLSLFFINSLIIISFPSKITFSQWEEQNSGTTQPLFCVSAVNDNVCWAAGWNQTVIRTTNGGAKWNTVMTGGSASIEDIYAFDGDKAQIVKRISGPSEILVTSNGGVNWNVCFSTSSIINCLNYISPDSGMVSAIDPTYTKFNIWKTINAGVNWDSAGLGKPLTIAGNEGPFDLFVMGKNAWFITNHKRVLYTSNFGVNWMSQPLNDSNYLLGYGIWFNTPTSGICGGIDVISSTFNSGTNWITRTRPPGNGSSYGGMIGHGNKFWVGFGLNVSSTTDYGLTWTIVYTAPNNNFIDLGLARNGTTVWGIRSNGHITKGTNIIGINPISKNLPVNFSLGQNYPNPFNPSTHIRYNISQSSFVMLVVYDILGRQVALLVNEQLKPGEYESVWTANNMPSGVYFYKLTANAPSTGSGLGFSETKRMVVVK